MRHRKARIKVQRPLELRDRLVVAPGHVQNDTEVDLRAQRQRVETDGTLGDRESLGGTSRIREIEGVEMQRGDVIGLEIDGALEMTFASVHSQSAA